MPRFDQLKPNGGQGVCFPNARSPNGDHIGGALQEGSTLEPLNVHLEGTGQCAEIKGAKGLLSGEETLSSQPCGASLDAQVVLMSRSLPQRDFVREMLFRGAQSRLSKDGSHPSQIEQRKQVAQFFLSIGRLRHGASEME